MLKKKVIKVKKKASLRERLAKKREELKRAGPGKFVTFKEGTTRIRILPVGEENEWGMEVVYFYLGLKDNMAVISPATFGEKCAIMMAHNKLTASKNAEDRKFAKKFRPQRRFMAPCIVYKDDYGRDVNTERGKSLALMTSGVYQEAIDLYLDDDNGDFTDPINGYDLKIKRTGSGLMDTEYKVITGKTSKLPREFRGQVDLEAMIKDVIPSYADTKTMIEEYLNIPQDDDEEEEDRKPKKKFKKKTRRDL